MSLIHMLCCYPSTCRGRTGECAVLLVAGLRISALAQPPTDFIHKSPTPYPPTPSPFHRAFHCVTVHTLPFYLSTLFPTLRPTPHMPLHPLYSSLSPILPTTLCPEACCSNPSLPFQSICSENSTTTNFCLSLHPPISPSHSATFISSLIPAHCSHLSPPDPLPPSLFPVGIPYTSAYYAPG